MQISPRSIHRLMETDQTDNSLGGLMGIQHLTFTKQALYITPKICSSYMIFAIWLCVSFILPISLRKKQQKQKLDFFFWFPTSSPSANLVDSAFKTHPELNLLLLLHGYLPSLSDIISCQSPHLLLYLYCSDYQSFDHRVLLHC